MMKVFGQMMTVGAALLVAGAASAAAQNAALEVHGGLNVPTFDIADAAKVGPSFGGGVAVEVSPRVWLLGEADFGFHSGADLGAGLSGPDVNVYHFMAKIGYTLFTSADGKLSIMANLGAGALMFDVDGAAERNTYFAINAGGKLTYAIAPKLDFVLSPQGDIALTDEAELGTSNAWVWPFAAGLRIRF